MSDVPMHDVDDASQQAGGGRHASRAVALVQQEGTVEGQTLAEQYVQETAEARAFVQREPRGSSGGSDGEAAAGQGGPSYSRSVLPDQACARLIEQFYPLVDELIECAPTGKRLKVGTAQHAELIRLLTQLASDGLWARAPSCLEDARVPTVPRGVLIDWIFRNIPTRTIFGRIDPASGDQDSPLLLALRSATSRGQVRTCRPPPLAAP